MRTFDLLSLLILVPVISKARHNLNAVKLCAQFSFPAAVTKYHTLVISDPGLDHTGIDQYDPEMGLPAGDTET